MYLNNGFLVLKRNHLTAAWPTSSWGMRSTLKEGHEPRIVSGSFICCGPTLGKQVLPERRPASPFTRWAIIGMSWPPFVPQFPPLTSGPLWLADWKAIETYQPSGTSLPPHVFPTQGAEPPLYPSKKQVRSRLSNTITPSLNSRRLSEEGLWKSRKPLKITKIVNVSG